MGEKWPMQSISSRPVSGAADSAVGLLPLACKPWSCQGMTCPDYGSMSRKANMMAAAQDGPLHAFQLWTSMSSRTIGIHACFIAAACLLRG